MFFLSDLKNLRSERSTRLKVLKEQNPSTTSVGCPISSNTLRCKGFNSLAIYIPN